MELAESNTRIDRRGALLEELTPDQLKGLSVEVKTFFCAIEVRFYYFRLGHFKHGLKFKHLGGDIANNRFNGAASLESDKREETCRSRPSWPTKPGQYMLHELRSAVSSSRTRVLFVLC